jgi:formamidopyrimidine-DNA glycosylase
MPELPEVEVLVRHLAAVVPGKHVIDVRVFREKVVRPTTTVELVAALKGSTFCGVRRRGKYLLFDLATSSASPGAELQILGHLGMTGRMFVVPKAVPLPKHAAVVFDLGNEHFVFEDTRYFGRLTLDLSPLEQLGPEPLDRSFTARVLAGALARSSQPVKIKLLDQRVVAGVGNIYASEALARAGIHPKTPSRSLNLEQTQRLWRAIRRVLREAIAAGSTVPLDFEGTGARDGLFYYGRSAATPESYTERLRVYGRQGEPCGRCGEPIERIFLAGRSTFFCPQCQVMSRTTRRRRTRRAR